MTARGRSREVALAIPGNTFFDPRVMIGTVIPSEPADPRLSPEFEALEAEIQELESNGPARVDWDKVIRLSLNLLEFGGQDLLVGCWVAHALIRKEQDRGLAVGLGFSEG